MCTFRNLQGSRWHCETSLRNAGVFHFCVCIHAHQCESWCLYISYLLWRYGWFGPELKQQSSEPSLASAHSTDKTIGSKPPDLVFNEQKHMAGSGEFPNNFVTPSVVNNTNTSQVAVCIKYYRLLKKIPLYVLRCWYSLWFQNRIIQARWHHFHGLTPYLTLVLEHCYLKLHLLKAASNRLHKITHVSSRSPSHVIHLMLLLLRWLRVSNQVTSQRC